MSTSALKRPSALIPLAMSLAALAVVLGHIAVSGIAREPDEGAAAHIWQLLMAGQLPVVAFYVEITRGKGRSVAGQRMMFVHDAPASVAFAKPKDDETQNRVVLPLHSLLQQRPIA